MIWKTHPAFPEYKISEAGDVVRVVDAKNSPAGAVLYGRILKSGYRQHKLKCSTGRKLVRTNRLVAETFIGPAPSPSHHAAHNDGNRLNNHWRNLRWATPKENNADQVIHGTRRRGERAPRSRLRNKQVAEIRLRWTAARGQIKQLSEQYGVGRNTIANVVHGITYR